MLGCALKLELVLSGHLVPPFLHRGTCTGQTLPLCRQLGALRVVLWIITAKYTQGTFISFTYPMFMTATAELTGTNSFLLTLVSHVVCSA